MVAVSIAEAAAPGLMRLNAGRVELIVKGVEHFRLLNLLIVNAHLSSNSINLFVQQFIRILLRFGIILDLVFEF